MLRSESVHAAQGTVVRSQEFGQGWEATQGGGKRSRDAFNSFVHTCLGHRTLAGAIIQLVLTQELVKALRRPGGWVVAQGTAQAQTQISNPMALVELYLRYNCLQMSFRGLRNKIGTLRFSAKSVCFCALWTRLHSTQHSWTAVLLGRFRK